MTVVAELLTTGAHMTPAFYGWEEEMLASWLQR